MTKAEVVLWKRLKGDQIDRVRFRRQLSVGPYIADFCAPSLKLVVEVDGRSHEGEEAVANDRKRDAWFRNEGYRVIRVSNEQVLENTENVVRMILDVVRSTNPLPSPLPLGEGGSSVPIFSALVPNATGMERAVEVHTSGFPLKVALFTAASETFNKKNINATIAESVERFRPVVEAAREHRMEVRLYVSCAVACPFEGPTPASKVLETVELLRGLFANDDDWRRVDLDLADTIGVAHPGEIEALLACFDVSARSRMTLHLHDTFGRAGACVVRALEMGVRSFDGSAGGLGGCPYASKGGKRAPGNISTELLVDAVHRAGYETGVDPETLAGAGAYAREIVARANAGAAS